MIPIPLSEIAALLDSTSSDSAQISDVPVTGVKADNRLVSDGDLFVAIAGERVNGNDFAAKALEAGASGVLSDDPARALASGASAERVIGVPDVQLALGTLAREVLARAREIGNPALRVLAITGSMGKTTTKDLLAAILAQRVPLVATVGSLNNEIGLPMTVLGVDDSTATMVLEMGADHIGNIEYLTSIAPPDVAIVLAVARAHVGEFGGIENVAKAKTELVLGAREGAPVVLNGDDVRVVAMSEFAKGPVLYFSTRGRVLEAGLEADVYATDISLDDAERASFVLHVPGGEAHVSLRLVGEHHVHNALAAAAGAWALDVPLTRIAHALSTAEPASAHRMAVHEIDGITYIDDSYNANPDSMRAGLVALSHLARGRRSIAVLGQMLELGDSAPAEHAGIGSFVAEQGIDELVAVGDGLETLVAAAKAGGVAVTEIEQSKETSAYLHSHLRDGDVVLFKGSHGSNVWAVADAMIEGEEATH